MAKWIATVIRVMEEHYEVELRQDSRPTYAQILGCGFSNPNQTFVRSERVVKVEETK